MIKKSEKFREEDMDKKRKVPKLRFPGFTEEWAEKKLGEITKRITRKNTNLQSTLALTISAQDGLIDQNAYFNKRVASRDISNYYLIKKGEFAYNKSYSDGFPFGAIKRLERYEMGVLSTLYIVFALNSALINSDYLVSYFDTDKWHQQIAKRASEGARNHGLLNISANDYFDIKVILPKDLKEQNQIGDFVKKLDNLIILHREKLEHWKEIKKGLLQKMFPNKEKQFPEIRFTGFTDAWEQRKLGEIVDVCSGKDYKHLSKGDIPVYGTGGYMLSVNEALSYNRDAIGIGRKGTIDRPYIIKAPFWTVDTLFYAIPRKNIDLNFAFGIFQNIDWKKKDESTGVPSLSKTVINEVDILATSYEEQQVIGSYFSNFDHLITLHQRKLDHLKELKKGLLQQMFV